MKKEISQKIRIYPNKSQERELDKQFNYRVFIWNLGIKALAYLKKRKESITSYKIRDTIKELLSKIKTKPTGYADIVSTTADALKKSYDKMKYHNKLPRTIDRNILYGTFKLFKHETGRYFKTDKNGRLMLPRHLLIKASESQRYPGYAKYLNVSKDHFSDISNHMQKVQYRIFRLYAKMDALKANFFRKATSELFSRYDFVGHESLSIHGTRHSGKHTSHSLQLCSLYRLLNDVDQKAALENKGSVKVAGNYLSSQLCSKCGKKNSEEKDLSSRTLTCDCGLTIDRDVNAAINIYNESRRICQSSETEPETNRS